LKPDKLVEIRRQSCGKSGYGLVDKVLKMSDVVGMIDARDVPALRGPYKKRIAHEISN
jgi:hypothetical protein